MTTLARSNSVKPRLARMLVQVGLASGLGLDGRYPGLASPVPSPVPFVPTLGPAILRSLAEPIAQSAPPGLPSPSPAPTCDAPCAAISPPAVPGLSNPPPYRWNSTLAPEELTPEGLTPEGLPPDEFPRGTIIIGRLPQHPYRVAIPGNDPSQLQRLRPYIADALILSSPRGPYLQAASFRDRPSAEAVSRWLHKLGFSEARVIYWR